MAGGKIPVAIGIEAVPAFQKKSIPVTTAVPMHCTGRTGQCRMQSAKNCAHTLL
jgi:hypothetical protein